MGIIKGYKGGGRRQGARNRISTSLLVAFADDFEKYGDETVRICRIEKPIEYLKIAASLLPKEFEITHNQLQEVSDDELDELINRVRGELQRSIVEELDVGEGETARREPPCLLPALPKTA